MEVLRESQISRIIHAVPRWRLISPSNHPFCGLSTFIWPILELTKALYGFLSSS